MTEMVMGGLETVPTMHHCHTPEIALTSPTTATGIWATPGESPNTGAAATKSRPPDTPVSSWRR